MEHGSDHIKKTRLEIAAGCDVKTEAQLLLAMEAGIAPEDFVVAANGLFFRSYSKDVLSADIVEDANRKDLLQLSLTRPGIYDQLPEGLFYQPRPRKSTRVQATEMAEDYKQNKKEEQAIRRFFMPLENEFFWQRIMLEQEECSLQESLLSGVLHDYFVNFWGLDKTIPQHLLIALVLLLPHAHKITGNIDIITVCLEQLLGEKVSVKGIAPVTSHAGDAYCFELGKSFLGITSTPGNSFYEPYCNLECAIGPLCNGSVGDYIAGGNRYSFLQTFYRYFMPFDVNVTTVILIDPAQKSMQLDMPGVEQPVLGFSSYL